MVSRKLKKLKEKTQQEEQKFHRRSQQWVGAALFIVATYFVITGGYHNLGLLGSELVDDGDLEMDDDS